MQVHAEEKGVVRVSGVLHAASDSSVVYDTCEAQVTPTVAEQEARL